MADYASSIQGAAIRVTRLAADGSLASGAQAAYVMTTAFTRLSFTPEFEEGEDITEKGANGEVCVAFKTNDTLKRITLEVAICDPDPEFTELLAGGTLFTDGGSDVVGYAAPQSGVDSNPNGSAVEVWSKAISGGRQASTNPYWHWVFPYVQLRPTGERVIENGLLANTFSGWGVGNAQFSEGARTHANVAWPFTTDSAYQYARTTAFPPNARGYVATV